MSKINEFIENSQLEFIENIKTYKRNMNLSKTLMIESNKKIKALTENAIREKELEIENEVLKYENKTKKIMDFIKDQNHHLEVYEKEIEIRMKRKYEETIESEFQKFGKILDDKINGFYDKYGNSKSFLSKLIDENINKREAELKGIEKSYRIEIKKMFDEVKQQHKSFKEDYVYNENKYSKQMVNQILCEMMDLDVENYIDSKYHSKTEEITCEINNVYSKIKEINMANKELECKIKSKELDIIVEEKTSQIIPKKIGHLTTRIRKMKDLMKEILVNQNNSYGKEMEEKITCNIRNFVTSPEFTNKINSETQKSKGKGKQKQNSQDTKFQKKENPNNNKRKTKELVEVETHNIKPIEESLNAKIIEIKTNQEKQNKSIKVMKDEMEEMEIRMEEITRAIEKNHNSSRGYWLEETFSDDDEAITFYGESYC